MIWTDEHETMLADCEKRAPRLTAGEREFVESLRAQLKRGETPPPRSAEVLDEVWDRVTEKG